MSVSGHVYSPLPYSRSAQQRASHLDTDSTKSTSNPYRGNESKMRQSEEKLLQSATPVDNRADTRDNERMRDACRVSNVDPRTPGFADHFVSRTCKFSLMFFLAVLCLHWVFLIRYRIDFDRASQWWRSIKFLGRVQQIFSFAREP